MIVKSQLKSRTLGENKVLVFIKPYSYQFDIVGLKNKRAIEKRSKKIILKASIVPQT